MAIAHCDGLSKECVPIVSGLSSWSLLGMSVWESLGGTIWYHLSTILTEALWLHCCWHGWDRVQGTHTNQISTTLPVF